ncbi:polysaccharide deacetylase family protein [Ruminococcus albus]|uniref:Polysaccharide deacetylase n=1 Tax=Ruminococcus albus TaxID=1264 RepID=A0A1I1S5X1_RUMAL|nr:polysaccharide deacetylase family protein [Ruminococcus albus]SFD41742.1 Polysaccharide deacetylase [Ruminococcus albus]
MNSLTVVMYHYTRDLRNSRYPNIRGMDISMFRDQIYFFVNNFQVVSMEDVIDSIERKIDLPNNALLLTFDDGYIDNYTFAFPVLDEYGVQGSFFIPGKTFATHQLLDVNKIHYILASGNESEIVRDLLNEMDYYRGKDFIFESTNDLYKKYAVPNRFDNGDIIFIKRMLQTVLPEQLRNIISSNLFKKYVGISEDKLAHELYMNEQQITTMIRHGMHIGVHGYDHYWLGNLDVNKMQKDIDLALDTLNAFIDPSSWSIAYPYGNYNADVLSYIKSKGAKIGVTTEVRKFDLIKDSPLEIPRFDCNDFPPKSRNYYNMQ